MLKNVPLSLLRREGDSNPRYSYPYGSLANCWFQPLTHLTVMSTLIFIRYLIFITINIIHINNRLFSIRRGGSATHPTHRVTVKVNFESSKPKEQLNFPAFLTRHSIERTAKVIKRFFLS